MHEIELIKILAFGLLIAIILGYFTQRMRLSPIVGYLMAGFIVGPHFPGYNADTAIASQLAEAGVILLMFGVGLHFNLKELLVVKNIAVIGAIFQSVAATVIGTVASMAFGMSLISGIVIGMGLSVASTVVLMKMLEDNNIMDTRQGHIVIGWLIAEDILTVVALVILPTLSNSHQGNTAFVILLGMALLKVTLFGGIILFVGGKIVPWILAKIAKTRSRELFTLTILATAFSIATVAALYFGVSFALGAFLAGMVVGNTALTHEATADILPMRDAFSVIFFISVGMLVEPAYIVKNISFIAICLLIVIVVKPLTAFIIVILTGGSVKIALTAAVGLAQIGEFSFILVKQAQELGIVTHEAYIVIIGCSIISIALNPVLFKLLPKFEKIVEKNEKLWKLLNKRSISKNRLIVETAEKNREGRRYNAIIIGFGPVGRKIYDMLRSREIFPVIIDLNIDTISELTSKKIAAVYGDASRKEILLQAGIKDAESLFITVPDLNNTIRVVSEIMKLNNKIRIFARVRYKGSENILKGMGVYDVAVEEEAVSELMVKRGFN